jgi:cobalt/nickel transport system permease protein
MTTCNRATILAGAGVAVIVAGIVSYFASANPDGLEKFQQDFGADRPVHKGIEAPPMAFKEYRLKWLGEGFWANAAGGVIGALAVLGILLGIGWLMRRRRAAGGTQSQAPRC